ncbi:MAG TPA: hypothetical protein VK694_03880 [Verrucomicrobiae bacterium]|nr:hypothetical protein [Verrucomicrobiae bacterium]
MHTAKRPLSLRILGVVTIFGSVACLGLAASDVSVIRDTYSVSNSLSVFLPFLVISIGFGGVGVMCLVSNRFKTVSLLLSLWLALIMIEVLAILASYSVFAPFAGEVRFSVPSIVALGGLFLLILKARIDVGRRARSDDVLPISPNHPQAGIVKIEQYKIPWAQVALLGAATQLLLMAFIAVLTSMSFIVALYTAMIFQNGLPALVYCCAIIIAYNSLKHRGLEAAMTIATLSMTTLYAGFILLSKLPGTELKYLKGYELTRWERLYSNPAAVLGGMFLVGAFVFVLFTYVTNVFRYKVALVGILAVAVLGLNILVQLYDPPTPDFVYRKVSDIDWAVYPRYLPPGVQEDSKDIPCSKTEVAATWYECGYRFEQYPGYLTLTTQARIKKVQAQPPVTDITFAPQNFFEVTVLRDDPVLDPYKYKDEKCDFSGLRQVGRLGQAERKEASRRPEPKLLRCIAVKTPKGKALYYDSFKNHQEAVSVPTTFYLQQKGNVVMVTIDYPNTIKATSPSALYLTDANFQLELYRFVDGIE